MAETSLFVRSAACSALLVLLTAVFAPGDDSPKKEPRSKPNRLAKESSPYLLQHAHNPVDWYPWGPEAFEKAKKEKKLIFLSVGYSSCHWCHVMEKESFSNQEVAEILNKHFVCIKVDREERPDIDEIYMAALSVIGARGGWPMSMFLTADGKPIIGGTYWPREDREIDGTKINGFKTILNTVLKVNQEKPKELEEQAGAIAEATSEQLTRASRMLAIVDLDRNLANGAAEAIRDGLDPVYGGLGNKARKFQGTKFPMPISVAVLQDHAQRTKDKALADLVTLTLDQMARGGIYDQLGGGFHRYSTERTWTVPHFEKMLYDNAQLMELYAQAYQLEPREEYRRVIRETLAFIQREMTAPGGAFYAALDADSNGKEGEFYVWTAAEIEKILGDKNDIALFRSAYGVTDKPNFEEKFHILKLPRTLKEVANEQKISEKELESKLAGLRKKLFDVRSRRERPFLDTKILTAWNGQMIAGYARAGQVLDEPEYIKAAEKAADFLLKNVRAADGRLLRCCFLKADGKPEAKLNAYLDDYAFLVHGLLNLYSASKNKRWLDEAKGLTDQMVKWHGDGERGGFFYTSSDHEKLFARPKDVLDGVQPSANGMAVRNLIRLSAMLKDENYRKRAERSMQQFAALMRASPSAVPGLCYDLHLYLDKFPAIATEPEAKKLPALEDDPKKSEDVVKWEAKAEKPKADGKILINIKLTIRDRWHVYANPSGNKQAEGGETTVTIRSKGKPIAAEITYPKGKTIKDARTGDYQVYEGQVEISAILELGKDDDAALEATIQIQACTGYGEEGRCLRPATIKAMVK